MVEVIIQKLGRDLVQLENVDWHLQKRGVGSIEITVCGHPTSCSVTAKLSLI